MATKLDNDLAKHISNFGYNSVDSLYIHTNGYTAILDGSFTANQTITIPDQSGTLALTSDLIALGALYLPLVGGSLSGQLKFSASGNVNSPAIEFVDAKLGIYRHGLNHLRIGVNGTAVQGWQATYIENLQQVRNIDGGAGTPSISFANYTDAGLYIDAKNTVAVSTVGIKRLSISDTNVISSLPITATIFQTTSGTFPTCAFTNSTNNQTGLYFGTTTTCGIACNGNAKFTFGSSSNTSFQQITIPDGTAGAPSLNFSSYPTTGIGSGGGATPTLYLTTNGSIRAQLNSNGVYFPTQIQCKDGLSNDPGYSFVNEQSSGVYRKSAGNLCFSVQSTDSLGIQQNGILLYGSTAGNNALYSASKLSYYEEGTNFNITWSHGNATSVVVSAFCTRIGRIVVFYTNDIIFNTFATNAPITIQSSASIPARFRPTLSPIGFFGAWGNDQAGTYDNWFAFVQSDGSITMYPRGYGASNAKFWIYGFCGTWII